MWCLCPTSNTQPECRENAPIILYAPEWKSLCKKYPNIDKSRVGIDGQSWGGYQTAYLVTRTDMFACAGSGAPVSNMTSAFGGIR